MALNSEILAPVGNYEMLIAAILSGADAVYIGGSEFSARAYANNFTREEMKQAIDLCHFYDMKVYVTVNTLIKENEMEDAVNFIQFLYESDVDAVILQDLGLVRVIRERMPDLDIHASTQVNTRNLYGARFLKDIGFSRIVLAREISIEEIKRIKENVDIELELFVHGSLCVCESGNCYMSSFIGGRSGNRGRCAQPCRKEYELYTKDMKKIGNEHSYLSIKDLNTLDFINETILLGIDSLKIEGRMKKPEYVYSTVMNYRSKIEGFQFDYDLDEFRNRAFTKGYQWSSDNSFMKEIDREGLHKGKVIGKIIKKGQIGLQTEVNLNPGDVLLLETIKGKHLQWVVDKNLRKKEFHLLKNYQDAKEGTNVHRISNVEFYNLYQNLDLEKKLIKMEFTAKLQEYPVLKLFYDQNQVKVEGKKVVEEAKNAAITESRIRQQLSKTGDTLFIVDEFVLDIDEEVFIPMGFINEIRREGLDLLYKAITNKYNRKALPNFKKIVKNWKSNKKKINILTNQEINPEIKIGDVYSSDLQYIKDDFIYRIPRIDVQNEKMIQSKIENNIESIKGFLVDSPNEYYFAKGFEKDIYFDIHFNIMNSDGIKLLKDFGGKRVALSVELNLEEINNIDNVLGIEKEILGYSPLLAMTTRYCPFSVLKKCDMKVDCDYCNFSQGYLKDSKDKFFNVQREQGFSKIYNPEKLETAMFFRDLLKGNFDSIRLDVSQEEKPNEIISHYYSLLEDERSGKAFNEDFTKGHYFRGVK